jgi:hypothetical protein
MQYFAAIPPTVPTYALLLSALCGFVLGLSLWQWLRRAKGAQAGDAAALRLASAILKLLELAIPGRRLREIAGFVLERISSLSPKSTKKDLLRGLSLENDSPVLTRGERKAIEGILAAALLVPQVTAITQVVLGEHEDVLDQ